MLYLYIVFSVSRSGFLGTFSLLFLYACRSRLAWRDGGMAGWRSWSRLAFSPSRHAEKASRDSRFAKAVSQWRCGFLGTLFLLYLHIAFSVMFPFYGPSKLQRRTHGGTISDHSSLKGSDLGCGNPPVYDA